MLISATRIDSQSPVTVEVEAKCGHRATATAWTVEEARAIAERELAVPSFRLQDREGRSVDSSPAAEPSPRQRALAAALRGARSRDDELAALAVHDDLVRAEGALEFYSAGVGFSEREDDGQVARDALEGQSSGHRRTVAR